jgi:hypothetical protein
LIVLPRRVLVKDVYRQNTKNDRTRRIPITPRLMALLTRRHFVGFEGHVFGDEEGRLGEEIKKAWGSWRTEARWNGRVEVTCQRPAGMNCARSIFTGTICGSRH